MSNRSLDSLKLATSVGALRLVSKDLSRKHLVRSLAGQPGLPAKFAQVLRGKLNVDIELPYEALSEGLVRELIQERCPDLAREIQAFEGNPHVASLGQVHRAILRDGGVVAIKVQFPEIRNQLQNDFDWLMEIAKKGGPPKKFQMEIDEYQSVLGEQLLDELDYRKEAEQQERFSEYWKTTPSIIVPKVFKDYSTDLILTQTFEEARPQSSDPDQSTRILFELLFRGLFSFRSIHSDFHSENFGYRGADLVLYDYGATVHLTSAQSAALYYLIRYGAEGRNSQSIAACFEQLGFDPEKLSFVQDQLLELGSLLAEPIKHNRFDFRTWNLGPGISDLLGGKKWWFRTAGPPWFLSVMRFFSGWSQAIVGLGVEVDFKKSFENFSFVYEPPLRKDEPKEREMGDSKQAKSLKVQVLEGREQHVFIELPLSSAERLHEVIPQETLEKIQRSGLSIPEIQARLFQTNFSPQMVFDAVVEGRSYRVWLD